MKATINIDVGQRPVGGLVAQTKPRCEVTVKVEGTPEEVERAVDAAELTAKELCGAVGIEPTKPETRVTVPPPPRDPGKPSS